ncbi:MAG: histidine kinase dimerization/phospho-acceptor domain-containing protein, partial [Armatimonadota bacterium]
MVLQLDQIVLLTTSLASIILGVVVYHRAPDRVWNRLFTIHASSVGAWIFSNYMLQSVNTVAEADVILRLAHPIAALVMTSLIDLAWVFPDRVTFAPWPRRAALYGVGAAFSLLALMPNLYISIEHARGTWMVVYGWPFWAFGVFTITALLYADIIMLRKSYTLSGVQRVQVLYTLTGLVVGQFIALLTMIILPLWWDNTVLSRWGSASYIFVIIGTAYAMAKYHLIRPRTALLRINSFLLTAVVAAGLGLVFLNILRFFLVPTGLPHMSLYLITGVLMGALTLPIYRGIADLLEPDGSEEGKAAVSDASNAVLRTLNVEEIPKFLSSTISDMLHPTQVTVYCKSEDGEYFVMRSHKRLSDNGEFQDLPRQMPRHSILVREAAETEGLLHREQIFRFRSLNEASPLAAIMEKLDTTIVGPMLWEDRLIGMVCVGSKLSGEMYSPEELDMLRNVLPQASLATRNAQLYAEMARMKEYNDNILRQMKSGIIAVDANDNVVLFNPAAEKILGLSTEDVENRKIYVLPEDIRKCLYMAMEQATGRSEFRLEIRRPDGEAVPVACSTSRWAAGSGKEQGRIAVISDMTLAEELERERQIAERLGLIRLLSAGMAHEIRNPLVAIRTFAELLPTRWEDEEFRTNFLETAQQEIGRIDGLVEQLLMLSKPADAVSEPMDMNEICQDVVRAMSARAETENLHVEADLQPLDYYPIGDQSRLHRALLNL